MIPTMTTLAERAVLRDWVGFNYRGVGAVAEIGALAGASTIALAQGMMLALQKAKRLWVWDTFTIPSGCETMEFRLAGTAGTTDDVYWGPIVAFPAARSIFNLPSWMDESHRLSGLFWLPVGAGSGGTSEDLAYRSFEGKPQPLEYQPLFDPLQANPRRVILDLRSVSGGVFVYGWRPFAELTEADTSPTTLMDHDTLITGALSECHRKIENRLALINPENALWHRAEAARLENEFTALLGTHDYAEPETEEVLPMRVHVRLR